MKELKLRTGAVSEHTARAVTASVSKNTERAYRRAVKALEEWLNGRELTDALLADYISELFYDGGRSPSGIGQIVAAVSWRLNTSMIGDITKKALAGIRREGVGRGRGQVQGITWDEVDSICDLCEEEGTLKGLRDALLIRLMSDCLLRVSEAVAVNINDFYKNTLTVRRSKTDQEGEGASLFVCDETFDLLWRYLERARLTEGALFRRMVKGDQLSRYRLSDRSAREIIKKRAKGANIEGAVSGHSLRVGAAESLAQGGATIVEMQTAGRWKDPKMPAHYARAEMASKGAVARLRSGKQRRDP